MIVYAEPDGVFVRPFAEGQARELVRIDGGRAEVVMAIFDIRRPFVGEGVFDAGADGPTEAFDVERAAVVVGARVDDAGRRLVEIGAGRVRRRARKARVIMLQAISAVDHAAGDVIERAAIGIAKARARRPAEGIPDVGLDGTTGRQAKRAERRRAGVLAGIFDIPLAAQDEIPELLIVPDLKAGQRASRRIVLRVANGISKAGVARNEIGRLFRDRIQTISDVRSHIEAIP